MKRHRHHLISLVIVLPLAVAGCASSSGSGADGERDGGGQDVGPGEDGDVPGDGGDGQGDGDHGGDGTDGGDVANPHEPDAGGIEVPAPDGGTRTCYQKPCAGKIRECGDCIDNDGDGLIDDDDPNCLGPCDNNEAGLEPKLSPLSGCDRDCYFDQDAGSGNDGCRWARQCDPLTPVLSCCDPDLTVHDGCGHATNERTCSDEEQQDPRCLAVCEPLTPNGCDCFGCCDIRTTADPTVENWVYLGSHDETHGGAKVGTCTMELAKAGDPTACRPCTPTEACGRPCGECQLCIGMSPEDLPAHCFDDEDRCRWDLQPCGLPDDAPCPPGMFCLTGCCMWAE